MPSPTISTTETNKCSYIRQVIRWFPTILKKKPRPTTMVSKATAAFPVCVSLPTEGFKNYKHLTDFPFRFLALGLKSDKPSIVIFDTMTQKKKKTLPFNDGVIKEWVSIAFAPGSENKHLISLV